MVDCVIGVAAAAKVPLVMLFEALWRVKRQSCWLHCMTSHGGGNCSDDAEMR